jgi:hypothetical protein
MRRDRLTWAAGREASAPPANPGYGTEDQDHPAHQPDPSYETYKKGDPDAWAETPNPPPYPQGNPPAVPGYDTEDQDHPAHENPPRVPKEARSLRAAIESMAEAKADRCLRLAALMLKGRRGVTAEMIEDQAFSMMDWPDSHITATANRLGGGFLAQDMFVEDEFDSFPVEDEFLPPVDDEFMPPVDDDPMFMGDDELDALLAEEEMPVEAPAPEASRRAEVDDLMMKVQALQDEIVAMKAAAGRRADQNDPKGDTLAPSPKTEEQVRQEAEATTDKQEVKTAAAKAARAFFASMDTDGDGFVSRSEWLGPVAVFAAADEDEDDIVTEDEVVDAMTAKKSCDMVGLDPEEVALLAEMETEVAGRRAEEPAPVPEPVPAPQAARRAEEPQVEEASLFSLGAEEDALGNPVALTDEDSILAEIFGGRVAKKADDDEKEEEPEAEEPEAEEPEAEEPEAEEPEKKEAAKKSEEDEVVEEEKTDKKARTSRTAGQRPQPRRPNPGVRTVGTVTAGNNGEIADLSRLWESAPDVSSVFNGNK